MHAPAFEAYVAPARARPALWRLILGLVLILAVYVAAVAALLVAVWALAGDAGTERRLTGLADADDPASTLLLLATFAGMAAGPLVAVRLLHRRAAGTLFGPRRRVLRHFLTAVLVAAAVYAVSVAAWLAVFGPVPNLAPTRWLALLPLALAGLLLQTGAEELVFRGYLQQQLAARFRSPLIWLLLPSLMFGAVHFDPAKAGGNALLVIATATAFGVVAADLVARTGSLGAAWGLHFANNAFAILFLATQGTIEGLSLYVTPYAADDTGPVRFLMLGDIAVLAITWAVLRRVLR